MWWQQAFVAQGTGLMAKEGEKGYELVPRSNVEKR